MAKSYFDWAYSYTNRAKDSSSKCYAKQEKDCLLKLENALNNKTLPFLTLPFKDELESQIEEILPQIKKFKHMLLLGIGGSALGAKALQKAFAPWQEEPNHSGNNLWILDNVDAEQFLRILNKLSAKDTIAVVVSKSGETIETMSQYVIVKQWLIENSPNSWSKQIIAITDEHKGELRAEARAYDFLSLPVPDFLGGRFSIFSAVGMLPSAYLGIDYKELLNGAFSATKLLIEDPKNLFSHSSWLFAKWQLEMIASGYSQLIFFCYIPAWRYFGNWFCQLWAESLGKQGKGSMPISAIGVTDQHSINQMILDGQRDKSCLFVYSEKEIPTINFPTVLPNSLSYLTNKNFSCLLPAEALANRMSLAANGVPLVSAICESSNEYTAGRFMQTCMLATVISGWLLNINPLDQPAVEHGKNLAKAYLGANGLEDAKTELELFMLKDSMQTKTRL